MKKGEKKIIKEKEDEIVVVEKVIHTKNETDLKTDPLILEISSALFALEERQSKILNKINQICTRIGVPKI